MPKSTKGISANSIHVINARIPGYANLQKISIAPNGIIEKIMPIKSKKPVISATNSQFIDVKEDWISLGGIDLQINGALGLAFPDLNADNADKLPEICQLLWHQGVDGFLPTLVTTSVENIQRSLAIFADRISDNSVNSQILGVHLEGPFLNYEKRGAHPAEYLLPLTIDNVKRVLGDYANIVKVITLAPELDPSGEVISYLRSLNIIVSLGHSQATYSEAEKAFKLGASMVTHAFNAMPSLHHREPGLLGAAIVNPDVMCGLIADGQHVSQTMMQILLKASRSPLAPLNKGGWGDGIFLVSDALSPLGLPDGVYPWDTRQIEVKNGTARLLDGTLSGTTLPLLVGVQNLVKWGICGVEDAIALATTAPRKAIGINEIIGQSASKLLRWKIEPSGELTWQRLYDTHKQEGQRIS